jgi:hypothetical protein
VTIKIMISSPDCIYRSEAWYMPDGTKQITWVSC